MENQFFEMMGMRTYKMCSFEGNIFKNPKTYKPASGNFF